MYSLTIPFTFLQRYCIIGNYERNVAMLTERLQLLPGVWLNLIQTNRFKTGCFSFNLLRPLRPEDAAPNALLPSILLRGCHTYPDIQSISKRLDEQYGASIGTLIRKKGEVQTVGLYTDFLEDCFAEGEPVFADMMHFIRELLFTPCGTEDRFVEEYVAGETRNLINAIDSRINDKRAWAVNRMLTHMCAGEAYAVPRLGEKHTLNQENGQSLRARWQNILATSPVELFYLGRQSRTAVLTAMNNLLGDLPRSQVISVPQISAVCPSRPVQYVQETMDVTQGKLAIGLRTGITVKDPQYPALMLFNAVFGGGMTSKLFLQIREDQSLCYYANSALDKFKGVMIVEAGVAFSNYQITLDGILHQLELCRTGHITDQELEAARTYLISSLRTAKDSPGRLDDFAVGQSVAGLTGTMQDLVSSLQSVTLEQVVEAANTLVLDTVYFLKGVEA